MIFGSVCSGIEAASVAWHPLGWRAAFLSEIEPFPRSVLAHHYPDVPLHGDFTTIGDQYEPIDLLVGGTPCQSFSVAGLRRGLDDDRGNLALEFLRLADRTRPRWLVWENVPGVLSSNGGRDFGAFLGGLGECGYGWAYRVLDAQYVRVDSHPRAVPQRRRRVFVVGYLGDWRRAAAVLFEREGMHGHPAPRREAGQGVARTISARPSGGGGLGTDFDCDGGLVAHTLKGEGFDASEDGTGRGAPLIFATDGQANAAFSSEIALTLSAANEQPYVASVASTLNAHYGDKWGLEDQHVNQGCPLFIAFDCKGSQVQTDTDGTAPTLRSMSHDGSHQNGGGQLAVAIQERATSENPDAGPDGKGWRDDGAAYTLEARQNPQAVAFNHQSGGDFRPMVSEECANALQRHQGQAVLAPTTLTGYGVSHANATETGPETILSRVREALGEEAFCKWGLGVASALLPAEILRSALHGCELRPASFSRSWVVHCALSRAEDQASGALQSLREAGCAGRSSQGREPPEQLVRELGAYLSELSQPGAQPERFLFDMWQASEGLGLLRKALSALQEAWRPACSETEPAQSSSQVRRLTVTECEFLQGFPRNYTLVPHRGKPAADGPRYKALGNSMAVNVMRWIGQRIAMVDDI